MESDKKIGARRIGLSPSHYDTCNWIIRGSVPGALRVDNDEVDGVVGKLPQC